MALRHKAKQVPSHRDDAGLGSFLVPITPGQGTLLWRTALHCARHVPDLHFAGGLIDSPAGKTKRYWFRHVLALPQKWCPVPRGHGNLGLHCPSLTLRAVPDTSLPRKGRKLLSDLHPADARGWNWCPLPRAREPCFSDLLRSRKILADQDMTAQIWSLPCPYLPFVSSHLLTLVLESTPSKTLGLEKALAFRSWPPQAPIPSRHRSRSCPDGTP
jgi:hypothetical protein